MTTEARAQDALETALGDVDLDTEEGRAFFAGRLATFGAACAAVLLLWVGTDVFAHLFTNLHWVRFDKEPHPFSWHTYFVAQGRWLYGACVVVGVTLWLLYRDGRRAASRRALRLADATSFLLVSALFAIASIGWDSWAGLSGLVVFSVFRVATVPTSARRTLLLCGAAMGVLFLTLATWTAIYEPPVKGYLLWVLSLQVIIGGAMLTLATLLSRTVFRLREALRDSERIGQYHVGAEIGRGAMGAVYSAHHRLLRRPTALKLLRPSPELSERAINRFEREAQRTAELSHPNTIVLYDYGRAADGTFYYAMEHLDGVTLAELVDEHGPQPPARVIHLLHQICGSLCEAHAAGLIHRDIKPANVMLCHRGGVPDVVKVLDFGLVREVGGDAGDGIVGTPLYMAPETIEAPGDIDARADLYAVGAVGYFLLTGKPLFDSTDKMQTLEHQLLDAPRRPSARLGQMLPADIERLIMRCLSKERDGRPASAEALEQALERCGDAGGWTVDDGARWWARFTAARS
ncbi:MAG: serine/threonine protein kinase [Myxococcales bacterium]|nr:serine/threonine protein kinase [Myxococcales bacterium]